MSVFETLREQVDLVELAGQLHQLCALPVVLTSDAARTPATRTRIPASTSTPTSRFDCYGCGWHGDVTDLWAAVKGVEAGIAAALDLAREFGVELPSASPEEQRQAEERRRLEAEYLEDAKKAHEALRQHAHVAE